MILETRLTKIQSYLKTNQLSTKPSEVMNSQMGLQRRLYEIVLVSLLHYVGLQLGSLNELALPIWPEIGVMTGLLCLRGYRISLGIFIGAFMAFLKWHSLLMCFNLAVLHTGVPLALYFGFTRFAGALIPLARMRDFYAFIALSIVLGGACGASLGALHHTLESTPLSLDAFITCTFSVPLSLMLFTGMCIVWDNNIRFLDFDMPLNRVLALTLLGLILHLGFCLSTHPVLIIAFYVGSCALMSLGAIMANQAGVMFYSGMTGLFLLSFVEMPAFFILKSQMMYVIPTMQFLLLIFFVFHLGITTRIKQKRFE